ncbi:preprotein translocase subunit SecE [Nocardioides sp.]|uniref:preprotein translocase subunit SecE n=1 Tax=Nocardioides sp. TaxID=35761 RepID=UPI0039E5E217
MADSKAAPAPRKRERTEKRTGPFTFYRQVVAELRKVVWPTREQLSTYFIVVLVFVLILMAITSLLDLGWGQLFFAIFGGRD